MDMQDGRDGRKRETILIETHNSKEKKKALEAIAQSKTRISSIGVTTVTGDFADADPEELKERLAEKRVRFMVV